MYKRYLFSIINKHLLKQILAKTVLRDLKSDKAWAWERKTPTKNNTDKRVEESALLIITEYRNGRLSRRDGRAIKLAGVLSNP